ncbi:SNF2-related protein [Candidatus Spongiihabitans sp.]|uniref:SNF2-related protein n=1 Tax=Candidatus Spongiihabitans sp. TaxID=3101308 RepID=UPI003C70272B
MPNASLFSEGTKVCRPYNPGRPGWLTGRKRDRGNDTYYQVEFQDGAIEYVPEYELDIVQAEYANLDWLIEQRKFGRLPDLRRNLTHIQLGGRLSSIIYSLDITNTEFYPHQFKPVLAFLESPSRGLLIADEVGLGKTIEAGLIWTELRARYDYRRVLVVCPAMLREKWREELRNRFGVDATIMDADELFAELNRPPNRLPDGKGIICSMQGIRPPSSQQQKQDASGARHKLAQFLNEHSDNPPIVDLVIIDEAHHLRNRSSQTARLGKMLRDISKNVLLLSATPINLKSEDLFSLLNIIDPDSFDVPGFFKQVLQANEPLIKARKLILDKSAAAESIQQCLDEAAGHALLRDNLQLERLRQTLKDPESATTETDRVRFADRIDRVNPLRHVVNRTRKVEVMELNVVRQPHAQFVELDEQGAERKFYDSVTEAIRAYSREQGINDGFLLANPQRQVSSCMYAAAKSWKDRAGHSNENIYEDMVYEDMGVEVDSTQDIAPLVSYLSSTVLPAVDLQELRTNDSKFDSFYDVVRRYLNNYPEEKIVVFSYFRATLSYLEERLAEKDIASQVLMGGMRESKQEIIDRFFSNSSVKVLLSSEVASEGVDLQFCRMIVNYDLPWNPMKIEQRIGRLDRIGQEADSITIWNLGYADTIDERIYKRLFERLDIFKRALGDMEAMLGERIKELTDYLISHRLTPQEEEDRISQTAIAIENTRQAEERLEKDASNLIAHGEYILERVRTAHDLKKSITEEDLIVYVKDYLNQQASGHEFHQPKSGKHVFDIKLPAATAAELREYIKIKNLHGKTQLATGDRVQCEFINKTKVAVGAMEKINQFHPLVRFISTKISNEERFPLVAVRLRNQENHTGPRLPNGQYAFSIDKWRFTGGLHEEEDMRVQVINIETSHELNAEESWKLLNTARLNASDWPEAPAEVSACLADKILDCDLRLQKDFKTTSDIKEIENKDRVNFQVRLTKLHRDRQVASLEQVLLNYRSRNQERMIPATEGRIKKINSRFDVHLEALILKGNMEPKRQQACCGVLLLN